jgi:hypothetical protein
MALPREQSLDGHGRFTVVTKLISWLMRAAGEDEVVGTAGLVEVAGHDDGTVVGGGVAFGEALRVEGACAAVAVGDQLGEVAGVLADEPGEVKHFAEGKTAEIDM